MIIDNQMSYVYQISLNLINHLDLSFLILYLIQYKIKSIGNSITLKRNLTTDEEVKIVLYKLTESVTERLRKHDFVCSTVQITIRCQAKGAKLITKKSILYKKEILKYRERLYVKIKL